LAEKGVLDLTHWDFERLILDKFHHIFQVKSLSFLSHPDSFYSFKKANTASEDEDDAGYGS